MVLVPSSTEDGTFTAGFSMELIKNVKDVIIKPLTKLIYLCIQNKTFPKCLKTGIVIPVFKKGEINDKSNYRPMSLLPVFSKILEKVLCIQLTKFFEDNKILVKNQFGFRKGCSTSDALLSFIDQISEVFESGNYCIATYLDLTKAFDLVSHETLIRKLYVYNIHPDSCRIISSFLTERFQRVSLKGTTSSDLPVSRGVPQGSVLGPLLFLIFFNDFPIELNENNVILFADDTTISTTDKNCYEILTRNQRAISKASDWLCSNGLALNEGKSVNMLFSLKKSPNLANLTLLPNIQTTTRFLGITIDDKLLWKEHGVILAKQLSKNTFMLRSLANQVSQEVLKIAFSSLIQCFLRYGILIWGHASCRHYLFSIQRRAIRIVAGLPYRADCRPAFRELNILTFPALFIYECLLYIKQNIHIFDKFGDFHAYNTRTRDKLCLKSIRLTRTQTAHRYFGIKFYNCLPADIKNLNLVKFKKVVKQLLINGVYYDYDEYLNRH